MRSAERFFLIGALSDYDSYPKLDADRVDEEVRLMRAAFTSLGYTEIKPPKHDRRGPGKLVKTLESWLTEREATSRPDDRASLVVYYSGHGVVSKPNTLFLPSAKAAVPPPGKPITPDSHNVPAVNLAAWARSTHVLDDYLLIVDTCMSGTAGLNIVKWEAEASGEGSHGPNLWVISAARKLENAELGKFAEAFTTSLAAAEGHQEQIDIAKFVGVVNSQLSPQHQQASLIVVTHSACGLLLDPNHMPKESPADLPRWTKYARGVEAAAQPGWYFSGREEAITSINEHLSDARPGPLVITGSRGTGKTALLRWAQVSASRELWTAVPPIAQRRTGRVRPVPAIVYAPLTRQTPVSTLLNAGALQTKSPTMVLVDVSSTEPPDLDVLEQVAALAQRPGLRVVVAGPPAALGSLEAARRVDLDGSAADLRDYLLFRATKSPDTRCGETELARRLDEVADQCCACFEAAAYAAGTLVSTGDVTEAVAAAGKVLTNYCEQELTTSRSHSWAEKLLAPLALHKPLTVRQWATLATSLSAQPYTDDDVRFARDRISRYLTHDEEKDTWLLRFSLQGTAYRVSNTTLLTALLRLVPADEDERHWDRAEPVHLELLANLAATPQGAKLLDDPRFLLTAPSSAIGEALRTAGKEPLKQVWHRIRHSSLPLSSRSVLLALHAHAAGLTDLAARVQVTGVPVEVLRHRPSPEDTDEITLVAVDSGLDAAHCVTVHDDEVVTVWNIPSVLESYRLANPSISNISACSVSTSDGEPVVALGSHSGRVAVWDCARGELTTFELTDRVEAIAVDAEFRVAAVANGTLHVMNGHDGSVLHEPVVVPEAKAVCIAPTTLSVATETGRLHIWQANSTAPSVIHTVYRNGYSSAVALSYDGMSAAWMNNEDLWVDVPGRPAWVLSRLSGVRSLAVGDRWIAAVRATRDNSVRVWRLATLECFDIPLHEAGVAATFTGSDSLLVTTRSALICLRLG